MTFHWRGDIVCPEAGTALEHYIDDLPMIIRWATDHGCDFIGHAHPRDVMAPGMWDRLDVEYVDDIDEVLQRASCVIADNSSVLYEAGRAGLKTMVLNAPWYRRDVHHGLRFWDAVPGPMFDDARPVGALQPDRQRLRRDASSWSGSGSLFGARRRRRSPAGSRWLCDLTATLPAC